jgi:hypothetical protein
MYVRGSDKNIEYKRDLNGFFRGIIMSDADPIELYRCKIFVPEIHELVYDTVEGREKVRYYIAPDELGSLQPDDHKQLIETLPWAEQASSLFGEQGLSHYDAFRGTQTPGTNYDTGSRRTNTPNAQEMNTYVSQTLASGDIVKGTSGSDTNPFNPTGQASVYMPAPNAPNAHGIHGIPSVGAHVWVFFDRGDINCPVYFAACPSAAETNQVFHDRQYPDGYSDNYKESANVKDRPPEPSSETNLNRERVSERSDLGNIDPETRRLLYELTQSEVGGQGRNAQIAFMETVSNRAAAEGRSIHSIVTDKRYYEPLKRGITRPVNNTTRNNYNSVFDQVVAGTNITRGATHNASAGVARSARAGGYNANVRSIIVIGGETFYNKELPREQNWLREFNETS